MIDTLILALGAFALVFWIGLAYWVNKDARQRIRHPFWVVTATALGLVPLVGPLAYLLFRPAETRHDVRLRNAELAALEAQIPRARSTCPRCSAHVESTFLACPACTNRLRTPCAHCDAPLERLWQICPYCETPVEPELDLDEALTREVRRVPALDLVAEPAAQVADVK